MTTTELADALGVADNTWPNLLEMASALQREADLSFNREIATCERLSKLFDLDPDLSLEEMLLLLEKTYSEKAP